MTIYFILYQDAVGNGIVLREVDMKTSTWHTVPRVGDHVWFTEKELNISDDEHNGQALRVVKVSWNLHGNARIVVSL